MSSQTSTALDLIVGALRNINALEAGETPSAQDSGDALQVLNDMLDSWSTDKLYVFASNENVFTFTPGQYQYTIGNPVAGTFTATATSGSYTLTGVTVPAGLVVGAMLTDASSAGGYGVLPTSTPTTVVSIGTNTITMSAAATGTPGVAETITYTAPGNFAYNVLTGASVARPLRITNAYTRITTAGSSNLDYQIRILHRDQYAAIGLKTLPLPWPTDLYYDPTYPTGTLSFFGAPSMAGQLHLWTDQIFTDFNSITQAISLPQGYARAIKTNLAVELASEYGKQISPTLAARAKESRDAIRRLNGSPSVEMFFDQDIVRSRRIDASWIFHGGFNT